MPWRRKWQPTLAFLPGKSHGQRSLVGSSPWGSKFGHDWATDTHTFWQEGAAQIQGNDRGQCGWGCMMNGDVAMSEWLWYGLRSVKGVKAISFIKHICTCSLSQAWGCQDKLKHGPCLELLTPECSLPPWHAQSILVLFLAEATIYLCFISSVYKLWMLWLDQRSASSYRTGEDRKPMRLLEGKLSGKMGRNAAVWNQTASGCGYTVRCT